MQFTTSALSLLSVLAPLASAVTLSYDNGYSDGGRSLNVVSCSDGSNGLITRYGYQKQSDIPRFPYIGGSSDIAGWNSPSCGQCYSLEYAKTGKKVFILAIDHVAQGFNVAQKAMDELTNNQAVCGSHLAERETSKLMYLNRLHSDASMSKRPRQGGRTALFRTRREVSSSRHRLRAWLSSGKGIAKNDNARNRRCDVESRHMYTHVDDVLQLRAEQISRASLM